MVLTSTTSSVDVGAVSLDMFDRVKQELVWRGVVSKSIDAKVKPEKRQQNITKAAEKLLKNYPPKTKK
jgi:SOS response regulatory protein OraA/RecX